MLFRSWPKFKGLFKDKENVEIFDKDHVVKVKNIVFHFLTNKDLKDPDYLLDVYAKYNGMKYIPVPNIYVSFPVLSNILKEEGIEIEEFIDEVTLKDFTKISCLGSSLVAKYLHLLNKENTSCFERVMKAIADEAEKHKLIFRIIPYGLHLDPVIANGISKAKKEE